VLARKKKKKKKKKKGVSQYVKKTAQNSKTPIFPIENTIFPIKNTHFPIKNPLKRTQIDPQCRFPRHSANGHLWLWHGGSGAADRNRHRANWFLFIFYMCLYIKLHVFVCKIACVCM
jgi:hypothetical protein